MALNNLLTDIGTIYRNLKFGNDRPNGGNSGQPFIKKALPSVNSAPVSNFPDFLLRDPKNQLEDRKDDLERITKFLKTPKGLLFIAKQETLSLQNPIVPGRPNRSTPFSGLYNPLMTLGQVAGEGTGLHIEKQGLYPIYDKTSTYDYVYKNNHSQENTNRLTILYKSKISGFNNPNEFQKSQIEGAKLGLIPSPISGFNNNVLMSYNRGPNSGVAGNTTIKFASDRLSPELMQQKITGSLVTSFTKTRYIIEPNDFLRITSKGVSQKSGDLGYIDISTGNLDLIDLNDTNFLGQNSVYTLGNTFPEMNLANTTGKGIFTFTQNQLRDKIAIGSNGDTSLSTIDDFRKEIINLNNTSYDKLKQSNQGLISSSYTEQKVNKETRIGTGNPGKRTFNRSKLTNYDDTMLDRINMIPLYHDDTVIDPVNISRDLVKFRFEVIDNNKPELSTFIHFRAFLGAITDNFKSDWSPTKYVGRGENFYTYNNFSRDISFSFQVAAQSRAEMKNIYQKLQYLASSLAPDYSNGYMKGNLVRLTIGDYLYIVPGIITNLSYNIPEEASWEIALSEPENGGDTGLMETPKYFIVNVSFTPIHDFVPQLGNNKSTALITPSKSTNSYLTDNPTTPDAEDAKFLNNYVTNGSNKTPTPIIKIQDYPGGETNFTGTSPINSNAQSL